MIKLKVKKYTRKKTIFDLKSFHGFPYLQNEDGSTRFWHNIIDGRLVGIRGSFKPPIGVKYMLKIIERDKSDTTD